MSSICHKSSRCISCVAATPQRSGIVILNRHNARFNAQLAAHSQMLSGSHSTFSTNSRAHSNPFEPSSRLLRQPKKAKPKSRRTDGHPSYHRLAKDLDKLRPSDEFYSETNGGSKFSSSNEHKPPDSPSFTIRRGGQQLDSLAESGRPTARNKDMFLGLMIDQLRALGASLRAGDHATVAWGLESAEELNAQLDSFSRELEHCSLMAREGYISKGNNPLFSRLRQAFINGSVRYLGTELRYAFLESVVASRIPDGESANQKRLADLRHPVEWYPATRAIHRTVHLHIGPTNSGKTYHALKRLEAAKSGIYAGPLRLLAHEVYTRLNAKGKNCALLTGEERRIPERIPGIGETSSCTVEMVPLNTEVEVAVIDEIQMLGDADRGWAWTQALLGVQAHEVHLCGEVRTLDLITELCKKMGDKLIVHRYERLTPLQTEQKALKHDLSKLKKGDAIILFSRVAIHAMKAAVEAKTNRRCAIVYGSLPPETRALQAALFNDPDNDYDFLVASDAVGMGLNLSIKRVIFESTAKHDGIGFRQMHTSEIKQIAGRAGRFKTAHDAIKQGKATGLDPQALAVLPEPASTNRGFVTTLDSGDLPALRKAMSTEAEQLTTAGIFPPNDTIARFASYFPANTPLSYIVLRLHDIAVHDSSFRICRLKEQVQIADLIQPLKLTIFDRLVFMGAPVAMREAGFHKVLRELASCVAEQSGGELLDLETLPLDLLEQNIHDHSTGVKGYLRDAESLHKCITLYLWLSYRFPGVFRSQALAFHVKGLIEAKIDECLNEVGYDEKLMKRKQRMLRKMVALRDQNAAKLASGELVDVEASGALVPNEPEPIVDDIEEEEEDDDEEEEAAGTDESPASDVNIPTPFEMDVDGDENQGTHGNADRIEVEALLPIDDNTGSTQKEQRVGV